MAKLEIEERAWSDPRLKKVAKKLRAGRGEVLGWLAGIWHDSQQLGVETASADDIETWMEAGPKYKPDAIREALTEVGYLEKISDSDLLRIDGNSWRIKRAQKRVNNAKAAISARWGNDEDTTRIRPVSETDTTRIRDVGKSVTPPDRETERQRDRETGRQGDRETEILPGGSQQRSLILEDPPPDGAEAPPPEKTVALVPAKKKPPTDGSLVWVAYEAAYRHRYGHAPVRNAKANALAAQLASRLGVVDAVKVVAFYLTHGGGWYVQKVHQLEYAVKDAEALRTQMMAGHRVTATDAHRVDKSQTNAQVFAATAARLERERIERETGGAS